MRNPVALLILGLTLASGLREPADAQILKPDVGAGRIAWFDLTTTDLSRSKTFYGQLFAWEFTTVPGTDQAAEIVAGGKAIGTIRVAEGAIGAFNGVVYVQVADMRASCQKALELGGVIPPGFPFDLSDGRGAIALVVDPTGHPVGLYSRVPLAPATPPTR
jgi:uncharacterized protein